MAMASPSPTAPPKVAPQAGVLEGMNPVHFDAKNPSPYSLYRPAS
ncbi:Na-H-Exchanger multi-domain protein [Pyrenophora tritici-repentis]|nr:Na-H-Exchanger multi-domain protein [Pyrenophora tritici-repentis]